MKLRYAGRREVLARMRRGDLPKRRDYVGPEFDDGTRVRVKTIQELVRADAVKEAPPHVGAAYTLPGFRSHGNNN